MKLKLETSCSTSDYVEITHARINMTKKYAARIRQLAQACADLKALKIEEFDYSPVWYDGRKRLRVDIPCMVVYSDCVHWECVEKHGSDTAATESIGLNDLP